jgi:cytoskeletal protein CcmA (bactofilin family)
MWKRNDETPEPTYNPPQPTSQRAPARPAGGTAVIGPSIRIQGDLSGDEDLLIEGQVEGKIELRQNGVTIGRNGRVRADVVGSSITVEGEVEGNLFADEQITVKKTGKVLGNLTAPRVSLEEGAKFKGSIDMEPRAPKVAPASGGRPLPAAGKPSAGETVPERTPGGGSGSGSGAASGSGASAGAAKGAG